MDEDGGPREEPLFPPVSRRTFVHGLLAAGAGLLPGATVEARSSAPRYLALIVLDGFRPDYAAIADMPALKALAREGTRYNRAWVGQLESLSPTGHATLTTGVFPRRHGLIGFEWRDAATLREQYDGWDLNPMDSSVQKVLRASGVMSIPRAMKKLHPGAEIVSISAEKVYAADAMGGTDADYILYYRREGGKLVPAAVGGHAPPGDFLRRHASVHHLPLAHVTDWDYYSTTMAIAALHAFRPTGLLINLPGADTYGHLFGSLASPRVMRDIVRGVDRDIGRIVHAYKQAGMYHQTLFVVTADHGMAMNVHTVAPQDLFDAIGRARDAQVFNTGGTASYIYLKDPERSSQVAETVSRLDHVVTAYHRLPGGKTKGYTRSKAKPIHPALDAVYRSLIGTMTGPRSPDVIAPFAENTIGRIVTHAYGHHGGLNWGVQHIPLVIAGPGVRSGVTSSFPARLVDIAATIVRAMGLPPWRMDGIPLADALARPTTEDIHRQAHLKPTLLARQNALIARYNADLAADKKAHAQAPPQLRPQP